jgi:hypothetical protein
MSNFISWVFQQLIVLIQCGAVVNCKPNLFLSSEGSFGSRGKPGEVKELRPRLPHLQVDLLQYRELQAAHEDAR